jgi:dipeptidyl aminopeptidase/acylaminoacyl peptidase
MLVVGELDMNVPPETTIRLVGALNAAGKDYELIVVPNGGHGSGGAYATRRMQEFFQKYLMGIEPPDHNVGSSARGDR